MTGLIESFLDRLSQARTLEDLNSQIESLRDSFDIDHVVYHSVNSTGEQYAALTYSPVWVERYVEQDYARLDPVVQGCYRRFVPVDWKSLDWSGKAQRDFMGEAIEMGVGNQGFSVPIRGPSGQFAMFTVSGRASDDDWMLFTNDHLRELILTAHYVNQKALELEGTEDTVPSRSLSPRETDTLRLLAIGFSRAQAADALKISEHTIRVYLESARNKLNARNTTHAVARALSQGLIVV